MSKLHFMRCGFGRKIQLGQGDATDEDLSAINSMPGMLKKLTREDVIVRSVDLCNDKPFKDGRRRMRLGFLRQLEPKMRGAKVLLAHSSDLQGMDGIPIGNTVGARLRKGSDGTNWLTPRYYTLADDPVASMLTKRVDAAIIDQASIGITFKNYSCSLCASEVGECDHRPGEKYKGETCYAEIDELDEVVEWSFVYSGMVDGTAFRLAAAKELDAVDVDALEEEIAKLPALGPLDQYLAKRPATIEEYLRA